MRCVHRFRSATACQRFKDSKAFSARVSPRPLQIVNTPPSSEYDAIVIGGGHNGLVSAAYLARAGLRTVVLESRSVIGGAAVTEEIIPGFKFSRFSYLAGLLRPCIVADLDLHRNGLEYLVRSPSSFTPSPPNGDGRYLILGASPEEDSASIAQFSAADVGNYFEYEAFLGKCRSLVAPLLDAPPPNPFGDCGSALERTRSMFTVSQLAQAGFRNQDAVAQFYELFTAPAAHVLDRWFEGDMLKATLATDAVIGALTSPKVPGSAYVLLHHVMGEAAGQQGVWAYARGGMGGVSNSIASAAQKAGADLVTDCRVEEIECDQTGRAVGVTLEGGQKIQAKFAVLSNVTPQRTFLELLNPSKVSLPPDFRRHVEHIDYTCGAFKINLAMRGLPKFACIRSPTDGNPGPQHRATIHFESTMDDIDAAYREAIQGIPATRPVIEMTIPSALDNTLAPPGNHVCQLFVQFAPYEVASSVGSWADDGFKMRFVNNVLDIVESYAPNFKKLIIGIDALSPLDLENILGLYKGNIFHGALGLHQLGFARPVPGWSSHRTPAHGLYLCGSGAHPGGGVMGAPGRNCARIVLSDLGCTLSRF